MRGHNRHGQVGSGAGRRGMRGVCGEPGYAQECTLDALRSGDAVEILGVDDDGARVQTLRFGMGEGAQAQCVTRIPAGPIVMRSGRQEIAVGRKLARRIRVRRLAGDETRKVS